MKNYQHIWLALVLCIIDVFSVGRGLIAIMAIFVIVFKFIPGAVRGLIEKNKEKFKEYGAQALIYGIMAAVITIGNFYLIKAARGNAAVLVSALDKYKAKYQQFPEDLQQLIPDFLPDIPNAKIDLFGKFYYKRVSDSYYALNYYILQPVGKSYDFSNQIIKEGLFKYILNR